MRQYRRMSGQNPRRHNDEVGESGTGATEDCEGRVGCGGNYGSKGHVSGMDTVCMGMSCEAPVYSVAQSKFR